MLYMILIVFLLNLVILINIILIIYIRFIISSGTDSLMILMGFDDGRIRVVNINDNNIYDLSDYVEYSIHDNNTGRVKMLNFSQDNRMLYTYGNDGNIFSFMFQCDTNIYEKCISSISKLPPTPKFLVSLQNSIILKIL